MKIKREQLNASIRDIPLPDLMMDRPVSRQGYPVPFFAQMVDGEWDFRVTSAETVKICHRQKLCWICGKPMGSKLAFVAGPMCVISKTSSEPPSHLSCGQYAAIACPFLAQPRMKRNEVDLPPEHQPAPGKPIMRNPGCAAVLVTRSYHIFNDGEGRGLFEMGPPEKVEWYAHRRPATRAEVMESIEGGLRLFIDECEREEGAAAKADAHRALRQQLEEALTWLPRD